MADAKERIKQQLLTKAEVRFQVQCVDRKKTIGEGAFGAVYEVRSVYHPESKYGLKIQLFGGRFAKDEAQLLADEGTILELLKDNRRKLKHERHMLYIYDFFDFPEGRAILSDFAHHNTLTELLAQRTLSSTEIEYYFSGLIDAVADCHRNQFTHNDIKTSNILLMKPDVRIETWLRDKYPGLSINNDGRYLLLPVLADYGVSKPYGNASIIDVRFGTSTYRSYELRTGQSVPVEVPDLFACGVCLYRLITSRPSPYHVPNRGKSVREVYETVPIFTDEERNRAGPYVDLCLKLLRFDPAERITTLAELRRQMPPKRFSLGYRIGRTVAKYFGTNPTAVYHEKKKDGLRT